MSPGGWREAVTAGAPPPPTVLVLGGFITSPPMYRGFRRELLARGAADVAVANVWTMDWLLAAARGLGPILTRSSRALLEASERSAAVSGGAPVLVVGHSAGGVSARLLTSPTPFAGRRLNASGRIAAIVTLGSPHLVAPPAPGRPRLGAENALFANEHVPGACFAPRIGYLAVTSCSGVGRRGGTLKERRHWCGYANLLGTDEPVIEGDGLIPTRAALLPGAEHIVFDDCAHGQGSGEWYGSPRFLDGWWPRALDLWQAALRARLEAGG